MLKNTFMRRKLLSNDKYCTISNDNDNNKHI